MNLKGLRREHAKKFEIHRVDVPANETFAGVGARKESTSGDTLDLVFRGPSDKVSVIDCNTTVSGSCYSYVGELTHRSIVLRVGVVSGR